MPYYVVDMPIYKQLDIVGEWLHFLILEEVHGSIIFGVKFMIQKSTNQKILCRLPTRITQQSSDHFEQLSYIPTHSADFP